MCQACSCTQAPQTHLCDGCTAIVQMILLLRSKAVLVVWVVDVVAVRHKQDRDHTRLLQLNRTLRQFCLQQIGFDLHALNQGCA